jgi:hypothetical protein
MTAFIDPYSYLPQTVDIGGDIYFLGPEKSIDLGFKSRKQFLDTFGSKSEYLLRKYMNYSVKGKNKLVFDSPEDKPALLKILKDRANKLKSSKEFTSSTLKNQIFVKSYDNIIKIIQQLEGSGTTNIKVDDVACATAKKQVKDIEEDHKFQMILEMAWYLLHPDKVPAEVGCEWAKMIEKLDKLRLGDIVTEIRDAQTKSGIPPNKDAFNYFKKINLQTVAKSITIENALEQAKKFATEIEDQSAVDKVKNRLKLLLDILEMKKYLSNDLPIDEDRMKIISSNEQSNTIKRSMITNPMKGGALTLNKPLGIAMKPLFDYFKVVYDPIYTFLQESIKEYRATNKNKIIIPQLTTLLHICNNINSSSGDIYGVYRITMVDPELLQFINNMINETSKHVTTFTNDKTKNTFNKQLFKLPKVRLSSLPNKTFAPALDNSTYRDPDTLPYIQFFTMGTNINLITKSILIEDTNNAIKDFYKEGNIYMVCTNSKNITERLPINVYDIDYSKVDININTNKIDNLPENYFNKNKDTLSDIYLESLLDIKPYVVYNDAELALSIFIALKELMPK